jgi:hypothetical protein
LDILTNSSRFYHYINYNNTWGDLKGAMFWEHFHIRPWDSDDDHRQDRYKYLVAHLRDVMMP